VIQPSPSNAAVARGEAVGTESTTRYRALSIAAAVIAMALSAQVAIPVSLGPVPMTLQPMVVLLIGGILGPRLGAGALALYLVAGLSGLPVFAAGGAGFGRLLGPTGGYLLAFPFAAAVTGTLVVDRGGVLRSWFAAFAGMVVIHLGGVAHLALLGGNPELALQWGSLPFVTADFGKIGIASLIISWARRRRPTGR